MPIKILSKFNLLVSELTDLCSEQLTKFLTVNENAYESQRKIKHEIKEEIEEKENKPIYGMFRALKREPDSELSQKNFKREPETTLTQPSKESVDKVSSFSSEIDYTRWG